MHGRAWVEWLLSLPDYPDLDSPDYAHTPAALPAPPTTAQADYEVAYETKYDVHTQNLQWRAFVYMRFAISLGQTVNAYIEQRRARTKTNGRAYA